MKLFSEWIAEQTNVYPKCFYFGSFNPIRNAHIQIATAAKAQVPHINSVVFIPSPLSPDKITSKYIAPHSDRVAMCKLAVTPLGFEVSSIEGTMPPPSYTVNTFRKLFPDFDTSPVKYPFLIGSDNLVNIVKWRESAILQKKLIFILATRGETINNPNIDVVNINTQEDRLSSTYIRDLIKQNKWEEAANLVPPAVIKYIQAHHLYV